MSRPVQRKALDVEILVIRLGVGDTPGHMGVVAEVGKPGASRKRKPDDIELRAGNVVLVVNIRGFQSAMRIARQ